MSTDNPQFEKLPPNTRAIVCGTRDIHERGRKAVFDALDEYGPAFVVQGGATGVDQATREWAEARGKPCATVHAWWKRFKGGAGPIRNGWMLQLAPDVVLAFPGGPGTANMVKQARESGVRVLEPYPGRTVIRGVKAKVTRHEST